MTHTPTTQWCVHLPISSDVSPSALIHKQRGNGEKLHAQRRNSKSERNIDKTLQIWCRVYNHSPLRINTCQLKPSTIHFYALSINCTTKLILHAHPLTVWSQEMHRIGCF